MKNQASLPKVRFYTFYGATLVVPIAYLFFFSGCIFWANFVIGDPPTLLLLLGILGVPISVFSKRFAAALMMGSSCSIWTILILVSFVYSGELRSAKLFATQLRNYPNMTMAAILIPFFLSGYGLWRLAKRERDVKRYNKTTPEKKMPAG